MGHKREVRTDAQEDKYNTVKTSKGEQGAAHRAMEVSFLLYSPCLTSPCPSPSARTYQVVRKTSEKQHC